MSHNSFHRRPLVIAGYAAALLASFAAPAFAFKIMAYNLLNYPGTTAGERNPNFRLILQDVQPDIFMAGEIENVSAASDFQTEVLNIVNPGEWATDVVYGTGDTLQVLYYRSARFETTGSGSDRSISLPTTPRPTPRWKLRPVGYTHSSNVFYVYGVHLKAASDPASETERTSACNLIRSDANGFPAFTRFLIVGDTNFYHSSEAGYTALTGSQADNDGRSVDVLNPALDFQDWSSHSAYAAIHTQSPRTTNPPSQPGGITGGLDDRFDFIFISTVLNGTAGIAYVPGSYVTYGQDGLRYNKAVNSTNPPNQAVSQTLADALWDAADHLPVYAEFQFPARIQMTPLTLAFGTVIVGATAQQPVSVTDTAPLPGETLTYTYFPQGGNYSAPTGLQSEPAGGGSNNDTLTMLTATSGVKDRSPACIVSTNARENSVININATGTVLDHATPSTSAAAQVLSANLNFGNHPVGGFTDQPADVHNVAYNSLQALLNVYDYSIAGPDAARFSLVTTPPADVGASPASFPVHFDDVGAADCSAYSATLTIKSRDPVGIPGAVDRPDITYNLSAFVGHPVPVRGDFNSSGGVDCADIPPFIAVLLNPAGATQLDLDTADMNVDCTANALDIQPFENALVCP